VNERGFSVPVGVKAPGKLVLRGASVTRGNLEASIGGWIFEVEIHGSVLQFAFCDREPLVLEVSDAVWCRET